MSRYTDECQLLAKGVTVTRFKADHPKPIDPVAVDDSEPTKAKVTAVYNALMTMGTTGIGYKNIARLCKVSEPWVKKIHRQMKRAESLVYAVEPK
jgi:hypothetical protein